MNKCMCERSRRADTECTRAARVHARGSVARARRRTTLAGRNDLQFWLSAVLPHTGDRPRRTEIRNIHTPRHERCSSVRGYSAAQYRSPTRAHSGPPRYRAKHTRALSYARARGCVVNARNRFLDMQIGALHQVLRAMLKGLRRPDQVPPLLQQAQAVGLLRKIYQPCEHVPLELAPGSVVHVANVWDRGDGDLVGLDTSAIATPKSALGTFALSAARARACVLLSHSEETRRVVGPAAKGLLAWRSAVAAERNDDEHVGVAPMSISIDEGNPVEHVRREADLSSCESLPLVLLEDCRPSVITHLYGERVIDELLLAIYRGPEPPRAALAVGDEDGAEVLMTW